MIQEIKKIYQNKKNFKIFTAHQNISRPLWKQIPLQHVSTIPHCRNFLSIQNPNVIGDTTTTTRDLFSPLFTSHLCPRNLPHSLLHQRSIQFTPALWQVHSQILSGHLREIVKVLPTIPSLKCVKIHRRDRLGRQITRTRTFSTFVRPHPSLKMIPSVPFNSARARRYEHHARCFGSLLEY